MHGKYVISCALHNKIPKFVLTDRQATRKSCQYEVLLEGEIVYFLDISVLDDLESTQEEWGSLMPDFAELNLYSETGIKILEDMGDAAFLINIMGKNKNFLNLFIRDSNAIIMLSSSYKKGSVEPCTYNEGEMLRLGKELLSNL